MKSIKPLYEECETFLESYKTLDGIKERLAPYLKDLVKINDNEYVTKTLHTIPVEYLFRYNSQSETYDLYYYARLNMNLLEHVCMKKAMLKKMPKRYICNICQHDKYFSTFNEALSFVKSLNKNIYDFKNEKYILYDAPQRDYMGLISECAGCWQTVLLKDIWNKYIDLIL